MATLVSLNEAKLQLRVTWDDEDTYIDLLTEMAEAAILDYIKRDFGWTAVTVPKVVKLSILLLVASYYDPYRDGDNFDNEVAMGYFPPAVTSLLHRIRKPAYA